MATLAIPGMHSLEGKSWTVSFIRQWWPHMTLRSALRYRDYSLREAQGKLSRDQSVSLRMKHPIRGVVFLRENASDLLTFEEVVLEQVYRVIPAHLSQCHAIIDLGAHIGLTSLYLAACYPSCRIVAVEPHPENYSTLVANLKGLIKAGRCDALQAAVWGTEKALVVDQTKSPDRYNACTVRESTPGEECPQIVKGLTIEKIIGFSGFKQIDLLKVDIEGGETELFKGDLSWLIRVDSIAIEFHGNGRESSCFDSIMKEYEFRICDENRHTVLAMKESLRLPDAPPHLLRSADIPRLGACF